MRRILALLILLAIPAVAQFGGPMGGMRPGSMQGGGLLPGRGGDPLWVAAGPTKPTLDFDFAKRKDLTDAVSGKTSLVNFSRSAAQSPGTYVGSDGLIHDAAVNLALYSEQFDNAAWLKLGSGVAAPTVTANQIASPDGKQTAEKIVFPAVSVTNHYSIILKTQSGASAGSYTYSVYLRGSVGGEKIYLTIDNATPSASTECVLTTSWQRCSVDYVNPGGTIYANFGVDLRDPTESAQPAQTVYAWGAQLEETDAATMAPTAYIHTTSQALAAPRFDHTPTTGNLTTNLLTYSEMLDVSSKWTTFNSTVTANATADPDGGTNADRVTLTNGNLRQKVTGDLSGQTYTYSFYAKTVSGNLSLPIHFSEANTPYAVIGSDTVSLTNDWQKFAVTVTLSSTSQTQMNVWFGSSVGAGSTGDFYVYQAQIEKAPTPGTYVRTLSETRSISDANAESLGLLVEEARANLVTYSEQFNNWVVQGTGSVTADQGISPDGTQTADLLDGATTRFRSAAAYGGATSARTLTVYAKTQSGTATFEMQVYNGTDGAAVSGSFTATTEWQRFEFTSGARTAADYAYVQFPSSPILFWGYQMEDGTFPTSYIPTVTSQYRYADVAAVQDEDFSTTNLLSYSESFDVGWANIRSLDTANAATAPDGTTTADYIEQSPSFTIQGGVQTSSSVPSTGTYTQSVYAKAGEKNFLIIGSTSLGAWFDLQNGQVGTVLTGSASIQNAGSGWYRCTWTTTFSAGNQPVFYLADTDGSSTVVASGGIYLWGASLTATEYPVAYTTTRNLLTDSQDFERGSWIKSNTAIDNDVAQAPDGTLTADRIFESNTTGGHLAYELVPVISGSFYTFSAYIKRAERDYAHMAVFVGFPPTSINIDLTDGSVTTGDGAPVNAFSVDSGNGWYRVGFSIQATSTTNAQAVLYVSSDGVWANRSYAGDNTSGILVWGTQLEPGTTATDYTRTVDVVGKDYGWYEPTEGTVFAHTDITETSSTNKTSTVLYGDGNDFIARMGWRVGGSAINTSLSYTQLAGANQAVHTLSTTDIDNIKITTAFAYNDINFGASGLVGTADTSVTLPIVKELQIGRFETPDYVLNGHIKRLTYWPRRQADSTLQVITQ